MCISDKVLTEDNKAWNLKLESQGWTFYSNYLNPDLLQKAKEKLASKGKQYMTLERACDCVGRTLPDNDAVSLWYRD